MRVESSLGAQEGSAGRRARQALEGGAAAGAPWLALLALLVWGWHRADLFHTVPTYGDVLEGTWAVTWVAEALRLGANPGFYPLAFHPSGWQVITYAWGPTNFLLMLPLYWLGGAAFSYNVSTIIGFVIAFAGMYLLAQRFLPRPAATTVALMFTAWGLRWYTTTGQLNIGLGSALLPWLIWALEQGRQSARRPLVWYGVAGIIWAAAANSSLYYIWIAGVAYAGWLLGWLFLNRREWLATLARSLLAPVLAALLSLPMVYLFWRATTETGAPFFSIYDVNLLGASLNDLPIPSLAHPVLGQLGERIYHGPVDNEVAQASLGTLTCLAALFSLRSAWRTRHWRPVLALVLVGLVLGLGLTLRWDDAAVQWPWLQPVNALIWGIAHRLRPDFFVGDRPPAPFDQGVFLPGLLLTALLPGLERGRVFARYVFVAGIGVFLLAGLSIARLRSSWLRLALAGLLLFEFLPRPVEAWPYPPAPNPAFTWLSQQSIAPKGMIELRTVPGYRLEFLSAGELIYATLYHRQPTVSGASSVWPGAASFFRTWLISHGHPFQDPEFMVLLRTFQVRYMVMHMNGSWDDEVLAQAQQNPDFKLVQCFPPSTGEQWAYPICVLDLQPEQTKASNFLFREGWSGAEDWGRWIDGTSAKAIWVGTGTPQQLQFQAFPMCAPGQQQAVWFEVNGVRVADHTWGDCEPWAGQVQIPPQLQRVGENELIIHTTYAASPLELGKGEDTRRLSIGVTQLRVEPVAGTQ